MFVTMASSLKRCNLQLSSLAICLRRSTTIVNSPELKMSTKDKTSSLSVSTKSEKAWDFTEMFTELGRINGVKNFKRIEKEIEPIRSLVKEFSNKETQTKTCKVLEKVPPNKQIKQNEPLHNQQVRNYSTNQLQSAPSNKNISSTTVSESDKLKPIASEFDKLKQTASESDKLKPTASESCKSKPTASDLKKLADLYPQPKNVVNTFYSIVANEMKDNTYVINPVYTFVTISKHISEWHCAYTIKWPEEITFESKAFNKQEASTKAAYLILHYLKVNKKITKSNHPSIYDSEEASEIRDKSSPIFFNNTVLTKMQGIINVYEEKMLPLLVYNIDDEDVNDKTDVGSLQQAWPELPKQRGPKYLGMHHYITKEKVHLPISEYKCLCHMLQATAGQLTRMYSVVCASESDKLKPAARESHKLKPTTSESGKLKPTVNDLRKLADLYPQPKNVVNTFYTIVANEMKNKSYIINPVYIFHTICKHISEWHCSYTIKWPEEITFESKASNKQDASTKAAYLILHYLKVNKKITEFNHPSIYDSEEASKIRDKLNPIFLNNTVLTKMQGIINIYEEKMLPLLVYNIHDEDVNDETDVGSLQEAWPELPKQRGPNYLGMHHYITKEKVHLPISEYKDHIIEIIKNNQIVIVKGEPGCGKSTRVPQYVLESWALDNKTSNCRIICTQPRRIAALSLAERVSNERQEMVGNTVGYQIRLKSNFNRSKGHILYCTTGILLRRLQSDLRLSDCSHIIIDEAHERDVNTDLLLCLLKESLKLNPNLKLIVMSATIDAEFFQKYYEEAAVVHIPGFTYPVKMNFLTESKELDKTMQMCEGNTPYVVPEDIVKLISHIHKKRPEGAILCFLPGWEDILKVRNLLPTNAADLSVLCLHSRLQDSEQRLIFSQPPPGVRKIILATNIAETSVTIDDVVYVIDTGIHKEQRFDIEKGIIIIDNHWISKASMAQRKGRAGRVKAGESFHLYPEYKYKEFMDYSLPEILRTSLTKIVLDSKIYSNNTSATEFLSQLLDPPEESAILCAIDELQDLELLDKDERLTPLGRVLTDFQLEPRLAKALVHAVIFKCVTPVVDIVTLFATETEIFASGLRDKEAVKSCKSDFSKSSDHLALMRMFEKWLEFVENEDQTMATRFCKHNNLIDYKMNTIQKLRDIHFGYLTKGLHESLPIADNFSDNDELVKAIILSGVGTVLQHRNFDIVKGRMKPKNVLLTKNSHRATITLESVNSKRSKYPSKFLMYINETRSNIRRTTVVRETSVISELAVLLFKNHRLILEECPKSKFMPENKSDDQVLLKMENTKIQFVCDRREALILKKCKEVLASGIQYYIYQLTKGAECNENLNKIWDEILTKLSDTLN